MRSPLTGLGTVRRPRPSGRPNLESFDLIVVSLSGGKDGQAALDVTVREAEKIGVLDRIVCVHADLGGDEWAHTTETVRAQARHYGAPLVVCSRIGQIKTDGQGALYRKGETFGDLHDYVRRRHAAGHSPAWYRPDARWCTSEFKRSPIQRATQGLIEEWRTRTGLDRACRVLSVQGLRAEESGNRAKLSALTQDKRFSSGRRDVWTWLPIHGWTARQVWSAIRDSGAPYHWAYDVGMPRLSCSLCIYAPTDALILAGHYNRERLVSKVELEEETGDSFKAGGSLADVLAAVDAGTWPRPKDWSM